MGTLDTINITVINKCSYPVRILTGHETETMRGLYTVLKPLEHRPNLNISRLVYDHLIINPKVSITIETDEES